MARTKLEKAALFEDPCACGNTKIPGLSICQRCLNTRNRKKYASSEEIRQVVRQRGASRHKSGAAKNVYSYYRFKAYEILGGPKCSKCGFDDPRALQIDHVNDDGHTFGRQRGGLRVYRLVIKSKGVGFQVLCSNCNWIKKAIHDGIKLSDYPKECPPKPHKGRAAKITPDSTYCYFDSELSLKRVSKIVGVSVPTLSAWWSSKFGRREFIERGVKIQSKAASKNGKANLGRRFKKKKSV